MPAEDEFRTAVRVCLDPEFIHQRVVIRGGYGLNYNQNEIAITANVSGNPGLTVSPNFSMNLPTSTNPGIVYQIPSDPHSLFGYPREPEHDRQFRAQWAADYEPGGRDSIAAAICPRCTRNTTRSTPRPDLGARLILSLGYQGQRRTPHLLPL